MLNTQISIIFSILIIIISMNINLDFDFRFFFSIILESAYEGQENKKRSQRWMGVLDPLTATTRNREKNTNTK